MAFKFLPGDELKNYNVAILANVPFIISDRATYYSIENRFLREAKRGRWKVGLSAKEALKKPMLNPGGRKLSDNTITTYADHLTNFLSWCEEHDSYIGVVDIDEDGVEEYAEDMEHGVWSQDGEPLAGSTVCGRLSTVIACTEFAVARNLRKPIEFTMVERSYRVSTGENSHSGEIRQTSAYSVLSGRRGNPTKMKLPSRREIRKFGSSFNDLGKEISAGLILFCGLRIDEVENIRDASVPTIRQIENKEGHANLEVGVNIIGKGGKERTIYIPPDLIEKIEIYRNTDRKRLLERSPTTAAKAALLLNNYGKPLKKSAIRKAWNKARDALVDDGFDVACLSPHIGRHAFAVYWLMEQIKADAKQVGKSPDTLLMDQVEGQGKAHLLDLKNILGHSKLSTTEKYLVMLRGRWRVDMSLDRQQYLDDGGDNG